MAITILYFLIALGAGALKNSIDLNSAVLARFGKSFVLTAGAETFVFNKTNAGYAVTYNDGSKAHFKKHWKEVQLECFHADAAYRQAEEDRCCLNGEKEYEEATQRLRGCRMAFDLVTGQENGNYWYAPEKSPMF